MIIDILWFVLGLLLLIKGGDWFVDGATEIAKKFGIPELLIGATVVSIGTTLPEVLVSADAAASGYGAMAYGNAIGSIICNTSLIAALTVAIRPSGINKKDLRTPVIFFFIAAAFYAGTAYITGSFTRLTGIILLGIFVIYMVVVTKQALEEGGRLQTAGVCPAYKTGSGSVTAGASAAAQTEGTKAVTAPQVLSGYAGAQGEDIETAGRAGDAAGADCAAVTQAADDQAKTAAQKPVKSVLLLVIGAAAIAWGANLLVDHGVAIASAMGVPQTVIALTFVALGTSLPELVTAINALVKGHSVLSLGNICGANLFNLILVSGISITIGPFRFAEPEFDTIVVNGTKRFSALVVDTPLMLLVMVLLTIPALITGKLKRWQGILLLCIYAAFCVYQFI